MTEEQKAARIAALAKGRATAAANRAKAKEAAEAEVEEIFEAPAVAVAEPIEPAVEEIGEPAPLDDFGRFLLTLDAETRGLLSDVDLRVIYEVETKRALEEKKAQAKLAVKARAERHAKAVAGLTPAASLEQQAWQDRMNEKVRFTPDLPEFGDVGLRIDQMIYIHGRTVTVTRAQYDSYRDIVYRNQQAELTLEGRSRDHWLRRQARGSMGGEMIDGVMIQ